jgi:hypothetical protein
MLKSQANTFYYNYLAGKGYNFNLIVYKLKYHFYYRPRDTSSISNKTVETRSQQTG